uniref:5-hydroxytryptamine (serotonin) receptor 3B n=1 Tax=Tetraodon nigroviridis TaxID=99883 RepID=H3CNY1_TETNG
IISSMILIWLLLFFSAGVSQCAPEKPKRSALNQLTRTLLRRYDCGVRPVHQWTSVTRVYVDLILLSVLDVAGKTQSITTSIWHRQVWTDEFLVWDPEEFDGLSEISLPSEAVWIPDVIVTEFVDAGKAPPIPYVYVNASGWVRSYRPMQVVLACSLEMFAFPFDKHNCSLSFRSWLHSAVKEIDLALWRSAEDVASDKREFMNDSEWELLSVPSRYRHVQQDATDYAQIQFNVPIRRRPLLYVVGLLIPSVFLMLVDVSSFYLPVNSRTRIVFKVSVLLGYTVFRVNVTEELPSTAVRTPLIGVFFVVCMALLMLSLIKSMLVVKLLHHNDKEVKQMSLSACLLDRQSFERSRLLPDYELETSLEEDLLSLHEEQKAPSGLDWLLQELASLRLALQQDQAESVAQAHWLELCLKLDRLLFWLYLLVLVVYAGTLLLLWTSWSFA